MTTLEDATANMNAYKDRKLWETFKEKYDVVGEFTRAVVGHFPLERDKTLIAKWIKEQGLIIHASPFRSVCINEVGNVLAKVLARMLGDKATVLAAIEDDFPHIYQFALNDLENDFEVQMAAGVAGSVDAAINALKSMILKVAESQTRFQRVKAFGKRLLYGIHTDVAAEHEEILKEGLKIAKAHPQNPVITELWQELEHFLNQPGGPLAEKLTREDRAEYEADEAKDAANESEAKRQKITAFLEAHFGAEKVAKWQLHTHPWPDF